MTLDVDDLSDLIVFMKVGEYGGERLPHIMTRVKAEYEKEKEDDPKAFYPFGYGVLFPNDGYTACRLRTLIFSELSSRREDGYRARSVDLVFSPVTSIREGRTMSDYDEWLKCCQSGVFPGKHDLGPKKGSWKHMDYPVRGTRIIPKRYAVWGGERSYYALIIEDLDLFTSPAEKVGIDLSPYRLIHDDPKRNHLTLNGQLNRCPLPCKLTDERPHQRWTQPVVGRAKLIEPYAVELSAPPFPS